MGIDDALDFSHDYALNTPRSHAQTEKTYNQTYLRAIPVIKEILVPKNKSIRQKLHLDGSFIAQG